VAPISEVARVVIVQQIIVTGLTVRIDRRVQGTEVTPDRADAGLRCIGAVAVGPAAVNADRLAIVSEPAVTVLGPPIIRSSNRIWIFDLIHRAARPYHLVMRRNQVAVLVLEPDRVAEKQEDRVQTSPTHYWLMVVVAHGEFIRECLRVGRVATPHVVKAHRSCAFAGRDFSRRIIRAEVWILSFAIYVGANSDFGPGE